MPSLDFFHKEFNSFLDRKLEIKEPRNLYEPISYIMNLGGKRLRPVLALMATDLLGGDHKEALHAALAVEVFHNFTLVHDDIMDKAPLRRGKPTVHKKWDINTGILSGDAMLIQAYDLLDYYSDPLFKQLAQIFNKTALEVCEGQQLDLDFETRDNVSVEEYLEMIRNKTAVLVAAALQMGAIIAGASKTEQEAIYKYGIYLGTAFQLQDDYLDTFGDADRFGKQIGGDIIENKKTYLFLKARELASPGDQKELLDLYSLEPSDPTAKIEIVTAIFNRSGAAQETKSAIKAYTQKAYDVLETLSAHKDAVPTLTAFAEKLMGRDI